MLVGAQYRKHLDFFIMEIWKDIFGYEGLYQISNYGRVKSLLKIIKHKKSKNKKEYIKTNKEIIKKISICKGYSIISLSKENKQSTKRVCRLVADAFIPNLQNKPQVNHIDGNKHNDNIYNLEWCTEKENIRHAIENKLIIRKKGSDCYKSKKVICLLTGNIFNTIIDFSKYKKIDPSNISRALSGKYKNNHNVEYYKI